MSFALPLAPEPTADPASGKEPAGLRRRTAKDGAEDAGDAFAMLLLPAAAPPSPALPPAPVGTVPETACQDQPAVGIASGLPVAAAALPPPPPVAEADTELPGGLGIFRALSVQVLSADESRPAPDATPRQANQDRSPLPTAPDTPGTVDGKPLFERLRAVLAARGNREALAETAGFARSHRPARRQVAAPANTAAAGDAPLGFWQPRAVAASPTTMAGAPNAPAAPNATAAVPELAAALQGRLPPAGENSSFQGIRLAVQSAAHGTVDIEVRCSQGQLAVALRLQCELPPGEAEACRREIVAACEEQGYQGVDVDVRHGRSHHGHQGRRGDDQEARLAGSEFPDEENLAVPVAAPGLAGPDGTLPAEPETVYNIRREGTRHGNR